jgi:enoyl-CoA hydratase/carnithine racemase
MEFENLVCVREGRVLAVSMNRPAKLNSLSLALLRDLAAAARMIGDDASIRAAVLTGVGRGFCAGADLTDPEARPDPGESLGDYVATRCDGSSTWRCRLANLPVPSSSSTALRQAPAYAGAGGRHHGCRAPPRSPCCSRRNWMSCPTWAERIPADTHRCGPCASPGVDGQAIDAERAAHGLIAEVVDDQQARAQAGRAAADGPTQAFIAQSERWQRASLEQQPSSAVAQQRPGYGRFAEVCRFPRQACTAVRGSLDVVREAGCIRAVGQS